MLSAFALALALEVVRFEENLVIPMRDGVRLATDIYRPARGGAPIEEKLPVLLQRTPYGKTGSSLVDTGEPLGRNRRMEPAKNTVYHDLSRPSHVVLPIVERR